MPPPATVQLVGQGEGAVCQVRQTGAYQLWKYDVVVAD